MANHTHNNCNAKSSQNEMPSFEHKKIVEQLKRLEALKDQQSDKWLTGVFHVSQLSDQFADKEIILYASTKHLYVHTVLAPLSGISEEQLAGCMDWSFNPYRARIYQYTTYQDDATASSFVADCMTEDVSGNFRGGKQLVFNRHFDGDKEGLDWEILQEFLHLVDLHHMPSRRAFGRINDHGDYEDVVSYTDEEGLKLVTVNRGALDWFAENLEQAIVQTFDFNLYLSLRFFDNPKYQTERIFSGSLLYDRGTADGEALYMRGVFAALPTEGSSPFMPSYLASREDEEADKAKIGFIVHDWRYQKVREVSAASDATTNYFDQIEGLPFDTSPAFFRPEVMQKYKTDTEKYTIDGRSITCRGSWYLKSFDVNEAGQISAYIYDLRSLPVSELMHWRAHNEEPKAGLSKRAIQTDFMGQFSSENDPLYDLRNIFSRWNDRAVKFWRLRDENLLRSMSYPFSENRDEWARDLDGLYKLCVEGYAVKSIRSKLSENGISFDNSMRSVTLLISLGKASDPEFELKQHQKLIQLRNPLTGHPDPTRARELGREAVSEFGGYREHFESLCQELFNECRDIEQLFE